MHKPTRNATRGRVPVVALHQHRQRYDDSLVVMRLADLVAILQGVKPLLDPGCNCEEQ